jgi:pyridoxine 5-phosphate synthase
VTPARGPVRLSVNVDHVATLRQARGTAYPDPVEAARIAEQAGAAGITVHLRLDRRHIQDDDVARLRQSVRGRLNLEAALDDSMLAVAEQLRPDLVTFVPERADEITTEGGLNLVQHGERVRLAAQRLASAGIGVSLFIDPRAEQLVALTALAAAAPPILGIELNTDAYTRAQAPESVRAELAELTEAGRLAVGFGFRLYSGHGLTPDNVGPVADLPQMEELNIGHALVSRAVLIGMEAAVKEMLAAMRAGSVS